MQKKDQMVLSHLLWPSQDDLMSEDARRWKVDGVEVGTSMKIRDFKKAFIYMPKDDQRVWEQEEIRAIIVYFFIIFLHLFVKWKNKRGK